MSKDVRILNLSANYVVPKVYKNSSQEWVQNGKDNEFFKYVNDRYLGSPTNSAVINNYSRLIYGLGLGVRNKDVSAYTKLISVMSKKDVKKFIKDFYTQGMAYWQIVKDNSGDLESISHVAVDKLCPDKLNDDDEIEGYWFSRNWKHYRRAENEPEFYPAYGFGNGKQTEILCVRPYQMGAEYFNTPSYVAGLQYAEMEEEISNFSINHIRKGFSAGYIVSIPDAETLEPDEKDEIERKIKAKLSGSNNAGSIIIDFQNGEKKIEVKVLEVSQSHKQWESLRDQSREQIMTAHEVVSPMLFGVRTASGFSNNADELDMAESQTMKRIIRPIQEEIIDSITMILNDNGFNIDLYFNALTEETPVIQEMSAQSNDALIAEELISKGEEEDLEEWELVDEREVDYENEDEIHGKLKNLKTHKETFLSKIQKFVSTGTARPNAKSEQDSDDIKIRYQYNPNQAGVNSREFCQKMVAANKIYRKEDIIQMGSKAVNAGFGVDGADTYSIWLYKGGARCHHKWFRKIYKRKGSDVDVTSPLAEVISTSKARSSGYKVPTNDSKVSVAPNNMPNNGFKS